MSQNVCLIWVPAGGEFLDSLSRLPELTIATEAYEPNVPIARNGLKQKGIEVVHVEDENSLPFENSFFDLVINRHESYSPKEVYRILKKNGQFITQQVGGMNDIDTNSTLGAEKPEYFEWNMLKAKEGLLDTGFTVIKSSEYIGKTRFYDIESIVYYLKCIPWQIEDFSVDKYQKRLTLLNEEIEEKGYKDFILHRFRG